MLIGWRIRFINVALRLTRIAENLPGQIVFYFSGFKFVGINIALFVIQLLHSY